MLRATGQARASEGGLRRGQGHTLRVFVGFAVLVLLLSMIPAPATAALNVRIAAVANFGGNYQADRWVPITITLANDGPDVTGAVIVARPNGGERYAQQIALPNRSQKVLTLYAQVPARTSAIAAYFETGHERVEAPQVTLRPLRQNQLLVGALADDPVLGTEYTRAIIAAYGTTTLEAITVAPDEIPANTFGLDSFNALIVGDATTGRWSPEQRAAVATWVARGGQLVVSGGANWRKITEGLGELSPLRPNDSRTVNGLSGLGGGPGSASGLGGQWVLATGDLLAGANRVAEQGGVPLVVRRTWGNGTVTSLAFEAGTSAFSGWSGATTFWRWLALDTAPPPPLQEAFTRSSDVHSLLNILRDIPNLGLPPTWLLGLILLLYIITIGPANYLVLRVFDRRELAWVTIPLLTLLFAGTIYGVGAATKGRSLIVSSVSVVRVSPGARSAEVQAIYGLFTPSRGLRDVALADGTLPTSFSENGLYEPSALGEAVRFEQGTTPAVRQGSFAQWTQQSFAAQGIVDPAPLALRAELRWDGRKVVGTITNASSQAVEDGLLVFNNAYQSFGTLAPGASAVIDWQTSNAPPSAGSPYGRGLGSVVYPKASGSSGSSQWGKGGEQEHRAATLNVLSGSVINYRRTSSYTPPPTRTPTPTATTRPGAPPRATPPAALPTTPAGSGAIPTTQQRLQVLYWRPDTPLALRVDAGELHATTLIIQEIVPGATTQHIPEPVALHGEGE